MAKKGRIPEAAAKAAAGRLRGTLSYDSFDGVDLVIEAAIEVSHCITTVSPSDIQGHAVHSDLQGCRSTFCGVRLRLQLS